MSQLNKSYEEEIRPAIFEQTLVDPGKNYYKIFKKF